MITISKSQVLQRWDLLPQSLLETLCSEETGGFLREIFESDHVPSDKVPAVGRLVGYVVMGFLHPEDLAKEIKLATELDQKVCEEIATSLNRKIFIPIRGELDKAYAPVPSEMPKPKMIDITSPSKLIPPGPAPANLNEIKLTAPVTSKEPSKISPLSFGGASITPPPAPGSSLPTKPNLPATPPASPVFPPNAPGFAPPQKPISTSLIGGTGSAPGALSSANPLGAGAAQKPFTAPQGQPFMLHKETEVEPLKSSPEFKLQVPKPPSAINRPSSQEAKPARLEIGNLGQGTPKPQITKVEPEKSRFVNYSQNRTPIQNPSLTQAPISPRPAPSTSPLTPPVTKPITPPQASTPVSPPAVPKTPTPPAPPKTTSEFGSNKSPIMGVHTLISPELKAARLEIAEQPKKEEQKPTVVNYNTYGAPSAPSSVPTMQTVPTPPPASSGIPTPTPSQQVVKVVGPGSATPTPPGTQPIVIEVKSSNTSPSFPQPSGPQLERIPQTFNTPLGKEQSMRTVPQAISGGASFGSDLKVPSAPGEVVRPQQTSHSSSGKIISAAPTKQAPQQFPKFIQQPESGKKGIFGKLFSWMGSLFGKKSSAPLPPASSSAPESSGTRASASIKPSFKPGEEVIDLSSLKIIKADGQSKIPPGPELNGNTVKLK